MIISPSPRAFLCCVGDGLRVTCTTTQSALTWNLTSWSNQQYITNSLYNYTLSGYSDDKFSYCNIVIFKSFWTESIATDIYVGSSCCKPGSKWNKDSLYGPECNDCMHLWQPPQSMFMAVWSVHIQYSSHASSKTLFTDKGYQLKAPEIDMKEVLR